MSRVALITGVAGAIGSATAVAFRRRIGRSSALTSPHRRHTSTWMPSSESTWPARTPGIDPASNRVARRASCAGQRGRHPGSGLDQRHQRAGLGRADGCQRSWDVPRHASRVWMAACIGGRDRQRGLRARFRDIGGSDVLCREQGGDRRNDEGGGTRVGPRHPRECRAAWRDRHGNVAPGCSTMDGVPGRSRLRHR